MEENEWKQRAKVKNKWEKWETEGKSEKSEDQKKKVRKVKKVSRWKPCGLLETLKKVERQNWFLVLNSRQAPWEESIATNCHKSTSKLKNYITPFNTISFDYELKKLSIIIIY